MKDFSPITFFVTVFISFVLGLFGGAIVALYYIKKKLQKQLDSVNKEQVKNMFSAFGRKPSEEQVNKMMKAVENMKKKSKTKIKDKKKK
jgi:uncharacterized protein YneF (UPF0154 family)